MKAKATTTTEEREIGDLQNSIISAFSYAGFAITTATGEPATLAVLDRNGNVIDAGPRVSITAWTVAITAYRNFLMGSGHLRVHAKPPGTHLRA